MVEPDPHEQLTEFVRELTEHQTSLRAFVRYLMAGSQEASDAAQEVNMLLWEKRSQFKPGTNFRAWAFTIARYVVLGRRRKQRRDGVLLFDPDLVECLAEEWEAQPDEHTSKMAALETCLEKLSDSDLVLVKARYSGHGEINRLAEETGNSANSLSSRLCRLRAALKQCVQRELAVEGGLA